MDESFQRHRLILIGSIAMVLILYISAYWLPHRRAIAQLQEQIRELSGQISQQEQQSKRLQELRSELAQLEAQNQLAAQRIPDSLNVKDFMATVNGLGQDEGVTISTVTPQITTKLVDLEEQLIRLSLVGRFPAIVRVVYKLETMPRKVEVTELEVNRGNKSEASDDHVEVQISVKLFARPAHPAAKSGSSG